MQTIGILRRLHGDFGTCPLPGGAKSILSGNGRCDTDTCRFGHCAAKRKSERIVEKNTRIKNKVVCL